ncbi:MAG: 2-oxoisovalerate dehydrogenase [Deltaproteobacteria bacterium]|nr:2-oxoisovalerate dehydrogenase [Deltaproteobacteria bacterium]
MSTAHTHPGALAHRGVSFETILDWYRVNHQGRLLEDRAVGYIKKAKGWSYHAPFAGHDGIQLILGKAFRSGKDFLFPYYRDLLTALAAGVTPEEIVLNGLSKEGDVAGGGRHMSNHFAKPSVRIQNVSSCTGNHTLHAVGVARGIKHYGGDEVAFSSQGESSTSEGYVFEALNGASRERLPVVFVVQNNGYGISVPVTEQSANTVVSENYRGIKDLLIVNVDGTDHFDCHRGMEEALAYVRSGAGPALLHAQCVRIGAHSNSDNHLLYRDEEERAAAEAQDPLRRLRALVLELGVATPEALAALEASNERAVQAACDAVETSPDPDPRGVLDFAWAPAYEAPETPTPADDGGEKWKLREAINETLHAEFARSEHTFLWGQDVASKDKGGVFNVTKGLQQAFGRGRVFNAPIAEDYIVGTANGLCRYRPDIHVVIEAAQFADYVWPAMEQMVEMSHDYWRTKGQFSPNVVVRLSSGGYIGGGLYHSQNVEAIFSHLPGVRVVVPSFADDAAGLLRTAIRSQGMTLFLEPKFLYNQPFAATPRCAPEHSVPFGRARVRREGKDVTVVSWGTTVHWSLRAAQKMSREGVEVEVIDLRSIRPWDVETVAASVRKTGRLLVVHEDHITQGFGAEVAATASRHMFEWLDAPVYRVGAKDIPVPFSRILERATLPYEEEVYEALVELARY